MLKKRILVLVAVIAILTLALTGCGGSAPTTSGNTAGNAAPQNEIKLVMATYITPSYTDIHPTIKAFVDAVNEKGKGKVQIDFYDSEKLLKADGLVPGLLSGTADIIAHTDSYISGTYPIIGVLELPGIYKNYDDYVAKVKNGSPLFNLINQELGKQNIYMLADGAVTDEYLWSLKPVKSPADFKGLRLRGAGRVEAEMITELGGASTNVTSAELYEALSRGTIDGSIGYVGTLPARSLQNVVKYETKVEMGHYGVDLFLKADKWNSLSQDVKDILTAAAKDYEVNFPKTMLDVQAKNDLPAIEKGGVKNVEITPDQEKQFKDAMKGMAEWWKKQVPADVAQKALDLATK